MVPLYHGYVIAGDAGLSVRAKPVLAAMRRPESEPAFTDWLDAFETGDVRHEDHRAANLDLEVLRHVQETWFEGR